jgi:hypothetical protein
VHDRLRLVVEHGLSHRIRVERSTITGLTPSLRSRSALAGEWWLPITSRPASISWETSRVPIAPLAPATKTSCRPPFLVVHLALDGVPGEVLSEAIPGCQPLR